MGNSSADPLFLDADGLDNIPGTEDDDLRLQSGSPAIDAGDNAALLRRHCDQLRWPSRNCHDRL